MLSNEQAWASKAWAERLGRSKPVGEVDWERTNVMGGSIAIGHPFGATGARVITTLVNRLVLGLGGALLFIGSTLLLMVSDRPSSSINTSLTRTFGYVGLALAATLLLRVVAAIVREGYN